MLICAAGIELHYARGVGYRFDTGKSEHDADEAGPVLPERSMQRLQMTKSLAQMRQDKKTQGDHYQRGGHRNKKCEAASLLRSKQVEQSDDKDRCRGKFLRMRDAKVLKGGERADCRRDQIVCYEQERANN